MRRGRGSDIHRGLVGARALVGTRYMADAALRSAYDAEIAPRTESALARIFARDLPAIAPRRALDLGAGTGAATRALRVRFGPELAIVAVDRVAAPGVLAGDVRRGIEGLPVEGPFDLIVAAHLLNELVDLGTEARAALVEAWCRRLLGEDGVLVIVEPALRETSRRLLAVRDALAAAGLFIAAPCLYAGPCPALARERDFCHDTAPWSSGADPTGRRRDVDFSYLVVRPRGGHSQDAEHFRVVSDRLDEKGRSRLWVCGPTGRHNLVLQSRDERDGNRAFFDVARGDLVRFTGTRSAGDGLRLDATSTVERGGGA